MLTSKAAIEEGKGLAAPAREAEAALREGAAERLRRTADLVKT